MVDGGVGSKEFTIEGGVLGFGGGKLLGKESQRGPGTSETLLQNSTNVGIRRFHSQGQGCTRNRVCKDWNCSKKEFGSGERGV